jgi:hypothetical protein
MRVRSPPRASISRRRPIKVHFRVASILACILALAACTDVVADDQISYTLTAVDEDPLPVVLDGGSGGTTTVLTGYLLGAPSEDECEYHVQVERGTTRSNLDGPIFDCHIDEFGVILIRIDVGAIFGAHEFRFER